MILQKENKILRENAKLVFDPKNEEIKKLLEELSLAMFAEPDGIGIAAPQIGAPLRVFLVAKEAAVKDPEKLYERADGKTKKRNTEYLTFINPTIKNVSSKKIIDVEGCLSVRGFYGEVPRAEKLTIEYLDENSKKHTRGVSGLFARVVQHEMDHLNGILFIDKAKHIRKLVQNAKK